MLIKINADPKYHAEVVILCSLNVGKYMILSCTVELPKVPILVFSCFYLLP